MASEATRIIIGEDGTGNPAGEDGSATVKYPRSVRLEIRYPTAQEIADIAFQWAASFTPSGRVENATRPRRAVSVGSASRYIERTFLLDAIAEQTRQIITRNITEKFVACLPDISEMLGWIAWDERQLYYVYTVDRARRAGVASQLLRFAGSKINGRMPMACMTLGGAALLNAQPEKWWQ